MTILTVDTQNRKVNFQSELRSPGQVLLLESWIDAECPTEMVQLGRSSGCAGSRGNFHSTWAQLMADGSINVWREAGDARGAWNAYRAML